VKESLLDSARGTLAGATWPPIVEGPPATLLALARHLEASQWLDAEALARRQFAQLGDLLPWLARHSPAFARRLGQAALDPRDCATAEGFAALPPVERRWFQQEEGVFCDAVPPGHEPIGQNTTSGSTGEFLRIRRTRVNQLLWLAIVLRDHSWWRTDFSVPLLTARAPGRGAVDYPDGGPPAAVCFATGPARAITISIPGEQILEHLEELGTGNLVIYPNALRTLIDAVEQRGSRPETLRAVRTIGEIVDQDLRDRAKAALGLDIIDAYTCQEAGYVALQCPESGLYHLMADALIIEVLRPDGSACSDGETGKVVITDLHITRRLWCVTRWAISPKSPARVRADAACRPSAGSSAAAATCCAGLTEAGSGPRPAASGRRVSSAKSPSCSSSSCKPMSRASN